MRDVVHAHHHAWKLLRGARHFGLEGENVEVVWPPRLRPANVPQQPDALRPAGQGFLKFISNAAQHMLARRTAADHRQAIGRLQVAGIDAVAVEDGKYARIGLVVSEDDGVVALPDTENDEVHRLVELLVLLPEIGNVVAQPDALAAQAELDISFGTPKMRRQFSNALRPVTACPRMSVWMSCVPSYVYTLSRFAMCRIDEYSARMPLAPSRRLASRAMSVATLTLLRFASETCWGENVPASLSRPRCNANS